MAAGEAAVAEVDRSGSPAQVTENVGRRLAVEEGGEVFGDVVTPLVVGRVHGDEFAARSPIRVLGVAMVQQIAAGHELVGDTLLLAVGRDPREDGLGIAEARGHMDLPALFGKLTVHRPQGQPVADAVTLPALGDRCEGQLVLLPLRSAAPAGPVFIRCGAS